MPDDNTARRRLGRDDWVAVALRALVERGPDAVAIEPLAATLGATKGSGYWHFARRVDLLADAMDAWVRVHTGAVIDAVEAGGGSPQKRLGRLLALVSSAVQNAPGEAHILASTDPVVRERRFVAIATRIEYIAELLIGSGLATATARVRAQLVYATFSGHAMMTAAVPELMPQSMSAKRRLHRQLLEMTVGPLEGVDRGSRPTTAP